jgi:hypothetical protein
MDLFDKLPYELRENVAKMVWTEAHSRAIHRRDFKYSLNDIIRITVCCDICSVLKRNSCWTTCGCLSGIITCRECFVNCNICRVTWHYSCISVQFKKIGLKK